MLLMPIDVDAADAADSADADAVTPSSSNTKSYTVCNTHVRDLNMQWWERRIDT